MLDEVTITSIGTFVQRVPNRTFARIVQIKRNDVADDNVGVYRPGVRQLGRRAALYPVRLAAEALVAGFTDQWVDGATVFSDSHEWVGGRAWSNRSDVALDAGQLRDGLRRAGDARRPGRRPRCGLEPDLLICGPANRSAAEGILDVQFLTGGESNADYKRTTCWCSAAWAPARRGSWPTRSRSGRWSCRTAKAPSSPRKRLRRDDDAFYRELYAYKARRRCAVAVLAPWLMQASAGA